MALIFNRPGFKSGSIKVYDKVKEMVPEIIEEKDKDGNPVKKATGKMIESGNMIKKAVLLSVKDMGKPINFNDEEYVLSQPNGIWFKK